MPSPDPATSAPLNSAPLPEAKLSPPAGFALTRYLKEALRIIAWNDDAIRRMMDDPDALWYGLAFWTVSNMASAAVWGFLAVAPGSQSSAGAVLGKVLLSFLIATADAFLKLSLLHLIAKVFMAADGSLLQLLRPLSLASPILLVQVVPAVLIIALGPGSSGAALALIGVLLGAIAWIAALVLVFDVVNNVPQLTTFVTAVILGVALRFIETVLIAR